MRAGSGAVLFALLLLFPACEEPPELPRPPQRLELEGRTITLDPGVRIREFRFHGAGPAERVEPDSVVAAPGDIVRFTTADALAHAIAFLPERLDPAQREFLESSGQLRSPPLLSTGAAWIVSLEGAPPGRYDFTCVTHGGRGTVILPPPD